MIVDVHQHYADESYYTDYTDYPANLVEAMDRYGWDYACVNGVGPVYHNHGNEEVARAAERFPERIIGIGRLEPDCQAPAYVDELKRMGMRGLKIIGTLKPYDDDAYLPYYERAAACGLPILFHTGFLGGDPTEGRRDISSDRYRPMMLDRIARLFPELTLIAAHMGTRVWYLEAVAVMTHPNVYGDISGGMASLPASFYRMAPFNELNWEKVLFGSDSLPYDGHIPFNHTLNLMQELDLDAPTREGILGGTAARIFGL